jgi:signal transduction histidine kinase/CheY-like chemotaxis protein
MGRRGENLMKKIMRLLYKYLISRDIPFEGRLFNGAIALCAIGSLVSTVATIIQSASIAGIVSTFCISVISVLLLIWTNITQNYHIGGLIISVLLCIIIFPVVFFSSGGISSGMLAYFILGTVIISILLRGKYYVIVLIIYCIAGVGSVFLSYYKPDLVIPIGNRFMVYFDVASGFVISSALIAVAIKYMVREFTAAQREAYTEKQRATEASQAKGIFLSNMSHEMRTPMNAIIGMTNIARNTDDAARIEDCLEKIGDASTHLLGVINDILDISKIEEGKLELSDIAFDFREVVERVKTVNSFRIHDKHQTLNIHVDDDVPVYLLGDDQHLAQVITNLFSNAIKFTPDGGIISLNASLISEEEDTGTANVVDNVNTENVKRPEATGDVCTIKISVSDTGIGISKEQQAGLFMSFQQADNGISRKYGGTGLGLAISKGIVEMMGGRIWIESEEGQGATFIFTFRAVVTDESAHIAAGSGTTGPLVGAASEISASDFAGQTILLAEDIDINREIVISLLESTGLEIDTAENGREAVDLYKANPNKYSLILMDIQMPVLSGFDATKEIRALGHPGALAVPIIAMTANVFREDIDKCIAVGMNDHIGKPLDFDEVIQKLRIYMPDGV